MCVCLCVCVCIYMRAGGGASFSDFVDFWPICQLFGSPLAPGLALWLSLAELRGKGGGLSSLFSFIYELFVHYLGRNWPPGWLPGSRSLSGQRGGRGGGHSFFVFLDV